MATKWVVDDQNQLKEVSAVSRPLQPKAVRFAASFFSYLLHPLFIPVYVTYFLTRVQPYLFAGFSDWNRLTTVLQVFVNCTFLPLVSVLLLKGLGFIESVYLKTQRERIIPFAISMIFYFWNWYVLKNNEAPLPLVAFFLAIFVASIIGFIANIYIKISMHTMAAGVVLAFVFLLADNETVNYTLYISVVVLLTGIVASSRLIVSNHTQGEIYTGLFVGVVSQLIAYWLA